VADPHLWCDTRKLKKKTLPLTLRIFFFNLIFHFDHDHGAPVATMPKKNGIAGWRQGLRKNCQNSTKSAHRTRLTLEMCPDLAILFLGCDKISPKLSGTCTRTFLSGF